MTYIIRKAVLGTVPEIEITASEFADLKAARKVLSDAFATEEKYEIVITNFIDLEKQLLNVAVIDKIRHKPSYSEIFETRSILNTRLVNLLTATRLYLDQLPQHVAHCLPNSPDVHIDVKRRCSEEYDQHFEFRFMEALRNHVQHRGIPIHFVRHGSRWTSLDESKQMEFYVQISAQLDKLEADEKFKKSVLAEIEEDVDLIATTRKYVESISAIHQYVRDTISDSVTAARTTIEAVHVRYSQLHSDSLIGISAFELGEEGVRSSIPLLLDWDDVRIQLQQRNWQLVNLSKRYVTSKIMKSDR